MSAAVDAYSDKYFENQAPEARRSASVVVPIILGLFPETTSVVDVGCGTGAWLAEFERAGVTDFLGIDGFSPDARLQISFEKFARQNLEERVSSDRKYDLAMSLEVAEHLTAGRAESFVKDLCALSDTIVFSAAIPLQGGHEHINEQWQSYWIELFKQNGFAASDFVRPLIWDNQSVEWWYKQNTICFKRGADEPPPFAYNLVHPELWDYYHNPYVPPLWRRILWTVMPASARKRIRAMLRRPN